MQLGDTHARFPMGCAPCAVGEPIQPHALAHKRTHGRADARASAHTRTHTHTRARTHTRTNPRTHAHTHTQTDADAARARRGRRWVLLQRLESRGPHDAEVTARAHVCAGTGTLWVLYGYSTGTLWVLYGYSTGTLRVLYGYSTGTQRVLNGYSTGTLRVLYGYSGGNPVLRKATVFILFRRSPSTAARTSSCRTTATAEGPLRLLVAFSRGTVL